jgi:hypothetical protein
MASHPRDITFFNMEKKAIVSNLDVIFYEDHLGFPPTTMIVPTIVDF